MVGHPSPIDNRSTKKTRTMEETEKAVEGEQMRSEQSTRRSLAPLLYPWPTSRTPTILTRPQSRYDGIPATHDRGADIDEEVRMT